VVLVDESKFDFGKKKLRYKILTVCWTKVETLKGIKIIAMLAINLTVVVDIVFVWMNILSLQLGFGKVIPSSCVWVDGISDTVSEKYLTNQFAKFGLVMSTYIDRRTGRALIFFETSDHASAAISEMRGKCIAEKKIQVSVKTLNLWLKMLPL